MLKTPPQQQHTSHSRKRKRKQMNPGRRAVAWALAYSVGVPLRWVLEKTGLLRRLVSLAAKRVNPRLARSFGDYQPSSSDVMTCVFFKGGTNWLMQICHQIAHRGHGEFESIHDVIPWPDGPARHDAIPLDDPTPLAESPTGLRVIKTHLPFDDLPFHEDAKYISLIRDPGDIIVSGYFFTKSVVTGPMTPSVESWIELFTSVDEPLFVGSWSKHVASFWRQRHRPNVLVLSFRQLKLDLPGSVRQIAEFMGVALTPEEFEEVVHRSSFEYMSSIDEKFYPHAVTGLTSPTGRLVRRGRHGGSDELLSDAQRQLIEQHYRAELAALGCDLPWDKFFGH